MAGGTKNSNKLIIRMLMIVVILIIVAIIGKSKGWIGKELSVNVEFAKAEYKSIVEKVTASGTVQPVTEVKITPEVSGEIIELLIKEGDSVHVGQLLIKLKPDNSLSALERAKASLNQNLANLAQAKAAMMKAEANFKKAELEFARQKSLFNEKIIPEADYEAAEAGFLIANNDYEAAKQNVVAAEYIVQSARATVKEASENLEFTNIRAPMSGIVSKLSVEKGEVVLGTRQMAGTEMLRIADLSNMEVRVDVNENDIIRVSLGDTSIIDVDSYAYLDKKFKGIVTQIANSAKAKASADAVTEFEVRIRILNESYQGLVSNETGNLSPFRPGMTASVEILTERKDNILAVPLSAVTLRPLEKDTIHATALSDNNNSENNKSNDREVVFINDNGKAKMAVVETGISDFDNIEIISGLEPEQEVVSGPYEVVSKSLKEGDILKKIEKTEPEKK